MAHFVCATTPLSALGKLLSITLRDGERVGDKLELLSVFVTVTHVERAAVLDRFLPRYKEIVGEDIWQRAETLYRSSKPLRWKVSYRGRLVGAGPALEEDQLEDISRALSRTPGANTLSFSFYRPSDHVRARALPASMPCPLTGDFKFRRGQLHLNVLFRTHDVYRLGFPDLYFMRLLQREILARVKSLAPNRFRGARPGELNVFFSRVFIFRSHRPNAERLVRVIRETESSEANVDGTVNEGH